MLSDDEMIPTDYCLQGSMCLRWWSRICTIHSAFSTTSDGPQVTDPIVIRQSVVTS